MSKIEEALQIIIQLGLPKGQQNERTALCLLALLNLTEEKPWSEIETPLIGITPMMQFAKVAYGKEYAPNTRETFRRFSMHQIVDAGIALLNPDEPQRPVNSPRTVYRIEATAYDLLRMFGSEIWDKSLLAYKEVRQTLAERYAKEREMNLIAVKIGVDEEIKISPGEHSLLIKAIIEDFAPRFAPGSTLLYAGDTGDKWGYFDENLLEELGVSIDTHGKMPDVVLYYQEKNWLLLIESVTSHGPVNGKRHEELAKLFEKSKVPLVYVTAFLSRRGMAPYLGEIAWETEVWCADSPSHLIHFNGIRFLGPYSK